MSKNKTGNREYKSDVFSMLMQYPENALQVYNALNHSDYSDPGEIEIITTNHGVSLSIRNDASFIINRYINYYEHQSTYSPNMPLRCLIYYVNDLEKYVKVKKKDLYSSKKIALPTPHFVIFYNGPAAMPETETMRLSAAYYHKTETPELEVICTAYNINPTFNEELKQKAGVLYGYMVFVEKVREYNEVMDSLEEAIYRAIDECIEEDILKEFFATRRDEVVKVTEIDMTFETREELIRRDSLEEGIEIGRKEGREIGKEEGIEEGKKQAVLSMVNKGYLTVSQGAEELGISEEELRRIVTGADSVTKEEQ